MAVAAETLSLVIDGTAAKGDVLTVAELAQGPGRGGANAIILIAQGPYEQVVGPGVAEVAERIDGGPAQLTRGTRSQLEELGRLAPEDLVARRYERFRQMGRLDHEFVARGEA